MGTDYKAESTLPGLPPPVNSGSRASRTRRYIGYALLPCLIFGTLVTPPGRLLDVLRSPFAVESFTTTRREAACGQVSALYPEKNADALQKLADALETDSFQSLAIDKLAGLIQVPSESYDGMGNVGEDPRWETMGLVHEYLLKAFPLIHTTLSLTKVNTYGLVYEWTGTNSSLKPYILAAHQDVVPVNPDTVDEWTHPPYSGHFDGKRIWGRGASDDKASLVGIMLTLETLIAKGWKPTRTIVLAFGFDEEASGIHGARYLGKALEKIYGRDAIAFVVDEGGGFKDVYGTIFATPGVAEKGHIDVKVEVASPGGHSSVPPAHTTIGFLAQLIVEFENNPFPVSLARGSVPYDTLVCYAEHGSEVPSDLRQVILDSATSDAALKEVDRLYVHQDHWYSSLVSTTQAVDIVFGGVKSNALPEQAFAIVNHRIATVSSVKETTDHDAATVNAVAKRFNLSLTAFGEEISSAGGTPSKGHVELRSAFGHELEPAPRTPTSGAESLPWQFLSGTIKATYNAHRGLEGDDNIFVSPGMSTGNTDTKYYWNLTKHIFRYNHKNGAYGGEISTGVHTVNENIPADDYFEIIRFFVTLIMNADEAQIFE